MRFFMARLHGLGAAGAKPVRVRDRGGRVGSVFSMPVGHKVPDHCPVVAVDLGSTSTRSWISAGDAARGLHDQRHRKPAYAATKDNQNERDFPSDEATTKLRWLALRAILAHSVTPLKWGWVHSISLDPILPLGLVSSLSVTGRSKPHSPMPRDWISTGVIEGPSKRPYVHIYVGIGITSAGQR